MKSQVTSSQVTVSPKGEVVKVYKDRNSAMELKQAVESAGVSRVLIDDHITPEAQVESLGVTSGAQAGFLLGTFYAGLLSILAATSAVYWLNVSANSTFTRLIIVGLSLGGGIVGLIAGKRNYDAQPVDQKQKSDPSIPRTFRVVVDGSQEDVNKAKDVVRDREVMGAKD